ncbi:hypothetical protein BpHYR1_042031 [Brachionus plicatilis]|uniref:Uncharacterized protein n=1 Tax=Brachionus plicatilis TaxID=10195 RepID=A0A3M7PTQ8_BRAPC|nr:hypothetical protein BpHYR1_042031 [Brachionus plicatilis]
MVKKYIFDIIHSKERVRRAANFNLEKANILGTMINFKRVLKKHYKHPPSIEIDKIFPIKCKFPNESFQSERIYININVCFYEY